MTVAPPALYVSCIGDYGLEESYVVALDPSDLSVRDYVALTSPCASRLAMRPDGYRLWVSHPGANLISVLQSNTLELKETIHFGDVAHSPYHMAIRTLGSMIFPQLLLACPDVNKIYVYNMYLHHRSNELDVETVRAGPALPSYVKLTPNGRFLYTYSDTEPRRDSVCVFDIGTDNNLDDATQIDEICFRDDCMAPADPANVQLQESVFNPEGTRIYIANRLTDRIEVIDTTANAYLDPIRVEGYSYPRSLAISPTGTHLYVGYQVQTDDRPGCIVILNIEDNTVIQAVEIPGNPRTMLLSPSGDRLFVAEHTSHEIYSFDIDTAREEPLSLSASINLDTVVDSGYANPVDILYLERRFFLPLPYAIITIAYVMLGSLRRLWKRFFKH